MSFDKLSRKGNIGSIETKNRLVMTAMGVGLGVPNGIASDEFIEFYTQRAKGGAGLIITEIARVNDVHGIGERNQLSLSNDSTVPSFKKLADSVHQYGTKIFAQLQHPGRETYLELNPTVTELVSSSPIPSITGPQPTRALTVEEIKSLVKDFATGAVRAKKAGMDGVEIHAAHGYLVHQFLSANVNHRQDEYGGSAENRRRFLMEIIAAIKESCGDDFPISVRLSSSEFLDVIGIKDGITLDQTIETAKACEKAGVALINVSAGTYFTGNTIVEPTSYEQGWKIGLAAEVKKSVSIPVSATSVIRDPEFAEKVLEDGLVDYIAMGRSWLADPEWGVKALSGCCDDIRKCTGCMYCFETAGMSLVSGEGHSCCAINPYMGNETIYNELKRDGAGRKVVVVGAGPAGMEAAMILAQREFDVTLFEKNDRLGGQMYLASLPPHRAKMGYFAEYCKKQLSDLNVDVRLNTEATAEMIRALKPYAVFLTTGSEPILPKSIKGIDGANIYTVPQILRQQVKLSGKKVVVAGGGLTGMETAEFLQEAGNSVTNIEMMPAMGFGAFPLLTMEETALLTKYGVRAMPGHKLLEIREDSVLMEDIAGIKIEIPSDAVVMSLGVESNNALKDELSDIEKLFVLGEANIAGQRVPQAVHPAFEAAYNL